LLLEKPSDPQIIFYSVDSSVCSKCSRYWKKWDKTQP
jgi:hypothetical protein